MFARAQERKDQGIETISNPSIPQKVTSKLLPHSLVQPYFLYPFLLKRYVPLSIIPSIFFFFSNCCHNVLRI